MHNDVSAKKKANEQYVELSDGRRISSKLEVGKPFLINREIINRNLDFIRRECYKVRPGGKQLYKDLIKAIKIANKNPDKYPCVIEACILNCTYIMTEQEARNMCKQDGWVIEACILNRTYIMTEQEARNMCKQDGWEGMCDEVICRLELAMRICNGEPVKNLLKKPDHISHVRIIQLRNGGTGYWGGSKAKDLDVPPADLVRMNFDPDRQLCGYMPYAYRRKVTSQ